MMTQKMSMFAKSRVTPTLSKCGLNRHLLGGILAAVALTACQKPADNNAATNAASTPTASATTGYPATEGKVIRIATEGTYKPFSLTKADGSLSGFDVELMHALCEEMKAKCEIKPQDWDGLLPGLIAKKYDAVVDAISITEERKAQVDFSEPYFTNTLVFVTKKGSPINPEDAAQIESNKVAAQRSTLSTQWMEETHPKAKLNLYENLDQAFIDLAAGRSTLMISDKAPAYYWLNTPEGQGFEVKGKEIDVNDKMAIALQKDSPLREDINKALAAVKANGTYDKIYQQYFGNMTTTTIAASSVTTSVSASTASASK